MDIPSSTWIGLWLMKKSVPGFGSQVVFQNWLVIMATSNSCLLCLVRQIDKLNRNWIISHYLVDLEQLARLDLKVCKTKPSLSITLDASPAPKQEGHCKTRVRDTNRGGRSIDSNVAASYESTSISPPARALTDEEIGAWIWKLSRMAKLTCENNAK